MLHAVVGWLDHELNKKRSCLCRNPRTMQVGTGPWGFALILYLQASELANGVLRDDGWSWRRPGSAVAASDRRRTRFLPRPHAQRGPEPPGRAPARPEPRRPPQACPSRRRRAPLQWERRRAACPEQEDHCRGVEGHPAAARGKEQWTRCARRNDRRGLLAESGRGCTRHGFWFCGRSCSAFPRPREQFVGCFTTTEEGSNRGRVREDGRAEAEENDQEPGVSCSISSKEAGKEVTPIPSLALLHIFHVLGSHDRLTRTS